MPFGFGKKKNDSIKKMPFNLFRSQSDEAKKKLQHQLYLAQENPEPYIDISKCEVSTIPSFVYSTCRVLNKEVLLVHENWITAFEENGKLSDLVSLRVLDLHDNEIKSLPPDIGLLCNLQVLNAEGNKLKKLPEEIGDLINLQTLNVKRNKLHDLPKSLCKLSRLRTLDISDNDITHLPPNLCKIRTLETLTLDVKRMTHPPVDVCEKGTEQIMKKLCEESGIDYQPPSNFVLEVLDTPKPSNSTWNKNSFKIRKEEMKLEETVAQYQSQADKKHKERIELEKLLNDEQTAQAHLAAYVASNKQHLIETLTKDQAKIEEEIAQISDQKEIERNRLFDELVQDEKSTDRLMAKILDINEKARKTEQLIEIVEQERREKDDWFVVRWEEIQNLRKRDVLANMEKMIQESGKFEISRQSFTSDKEHAIRQVLAEEKFSTDHQVEKFLEKKDHDQKVILNSLVQEEELQKHAFEVLQQQKDIKHNRITSEIQLIEEELLALTELERDRREMRAETELNVLCEKRIALCSMLSQLLQEQESRQAELRKRLAEMEEQRLDGQTDYWMVQFQRLMDSKPQRLLDQERNLEISIVKILQRSSADDYITVFAYHRITIETMLLLSEDDLKQMGVHEVGVRKSILQNIEDYKKSIHKSKQLDLYDPETPTKSFEEPASPSAPPLTEGNPSTDQTTRSSSSSVRRQKSITARGLHSECAICMETESQILFLNCGHVCCCAKCAAPLNDCPLCRSKIEQRIRLNLV